ncbi:MAG: chromosome segregation protein SMC [Ardenticatenales bacterium]|nr:chromosome segregation protein SMC [Ardenticatenales bacterium]
MRIKELSLTGYKSFASRTRFVFPSGVTAIIGPNGSGKSNIADAVRWVLGETRPTHLRARSQDDLIFAGTERRSRSGIAEVQLTIDNGDGGLDIAFAEVTIGRRVERDGTVIYSINGARVRLRDVQDLVAGRFGQGHFTVIGQGLVDSFIVMRPDQRRALIDDAAGLTPLQRQADRSLKKLADTAENLRRVRDILGELGPRLRRMERLAERAEQHGAVAAELRGLLAQWYGWHTAQAAAVLEHARAHGAALDAERDAARRHSEAATTALDAAASATDRTDETLRTLRAERDATAGALAAARQQAAVADAQLAAVERQRESLQSASTGLSEESAALSAQLTAYERTLAELATALDAHNAAVAEARRAQDAAEAERVGRGAEVDAARASLAALQAEIARLAAKRSSLLETRTARTLQLAAAEESLAGAAASIAQFGAANTAAQAAFDDVEARYTAHVARVTDIERALADAHTALAAAREAHATARDSLGMHESRHRTLQALFREAGTDAAVMAKLGDGDRVALRGTVAELIVVPDAWEAAAAAALGPFVRAAVVARSADIAAAVAIVRDAPAAAYLAPATVERPVGGTWAPRKGEQRAVDVLRAPDAPGLVEVLVADVAFVRDLAAANAAVDRPDGPARAATADGLLVHRGGAVTVGAGNRDVLAMARERRDLPDVLDAARVDAEAAGSAVDRCLDARRALEAELGTLADARAVLSRARDAAAKERDAARAAHERAAREETWATERRAQLAAECAALSDELAMVEQAILQAEPEITVRTTAVEAASRAAEGIDVNTPRVALAGAGAAQAEAAAVLAGQRAARDAVVREAEAVRGRAAANLARAETLDVEAIRWSDEAARAAAEGERLASGLVDLEAALVIAESNAGDLRHEARSQAEALEATRRAVAAVDSRSAEALVAIARAEDRIGRLSEQRLVDAEALDIEPDALAAVPDGPMDAPDEAAEARIGQLRRRLRDIGAIDREALAAYHETAEHHAHLIAQLDDLEAADRDLRTALATLDGEMAAGFSTTFAAVAESFGRSFPLLFGGGEAELVLMPVEEEGAPPGIDIIARPPGKRSQPLSLLSGGERAITAVALLFALLEVSGTPFVVLDEVDAALDEANVDRFRTCLTALAEHMQVVIVTHNRATVQSAATVYGITMAEDGASQVVSLKVDAAA